MGKITQNFRQSNKSISGSMGAKTYSFVQRIQTIHGKMYNMLKTRGKGGMNS